jgi:hypothetical protein
MRIRFAAIDFVGMTGVMPRRDSQSLDGGRSNDLIWANVVNNYLLGQKPPALNPCFLSGVWAASISSSVSFGGRLPGRPLGTRRKFYHAVFFFCLAKNRGHACRQIAAPFFGLPRGTRGSACTNYVKVSRDCPVKFA